MGNKNTDKGHRRRLRDALRKAGYSEAEVRRRLAEKAAEQRTAREAARWKQDRAAAAARTDLIPTVEQDRTPQGRRSLRDASPEGRAFLERQQEETYARLSPDDGKHKPKTPDPLTTGTARATGQTARAVKRGRTVTRYEYDEATG